MGLTNLPKIPTNDPAEKPDASLFNDNHSFLNMQQQNLIRNGGFEESFSAGLPDFWALSGTGAASAQDSDSKEGANAVKITFGSAPAILKQSSSEFKFYQGRQVKAWAFVKATVGAQTRLVVDDGVGSTASLFHTGGGTYELITVEHIVAAGATELTLELHVEVSGASPLFDLATMCDFESILGRLQNAKDIAQATKEFFMPAPASDQVLGAYAVNQVGSQGALNISFLVPGDWGSLVSAVLVAVPASTGGPQTVELTANIAADGEDATATQEQNLANTFTYVANQMSEFDISSVLTGITARDYVGILIDRKSAGFGNLDILGIRFKYNG